MNHSIIAFIPKINGKTEVQYKLHILGARSVSVEDTTNPFYNEYHMNVQDETNIPSIVSFTIVNGGVVKVDGIYVETYHSKSHLEISEEDGTLNSTDGNYFGYE